MFLDHNLRHPQLTRPLVREKRCSSLTSRELWLGPSSPNWHRAISLFHRAPSKQWKIPPYFSADLHDRKIQYSESAVGKLRRVCFSDQFCECTSRPSAGDCSREMLQLRKRHAEFNKVHAITILNGENNPLPEPSLKEKVETHTQLFFP